MGNDENDPLGVKDSSHLTDADWTEINKLKRAFETGGQAALAKALDALAKAEPIRRVNVAAAFFPDETREAIKDEMAGLGIAQEDLRELIRKLESPARDQ